MVVWEPLHFCDNIVGLSCCDPAADAALRVEFEAMNVPASDAACATIIKAILCQVSKGATVLYIDAQLFFFLIDLPFFFFNPIQRPNCLQIHSYAICGCC